MTATYTFDVFHIDASSRQGNWTYVARPRSCSTTASPVRRDQRMVFGPTRTGRSRRCGVEHEESEVHDHGSPE